MCSIHTYALCLCGHFPFCISSPFIAFMKCLHKTTFLFILWSYTCKYCTSNIVTIEDISQREGKSFIIPLLNTPCFHFSFSIPSLSMCICNIHGHVICNSSLRQILPICVLVLNIVIIFTYRVIYNQINFI